MKISRFEKLKKQKTYVTIGIFLTVIAFLWVLISILATNSSDQVDPKIKQAAKLFSPTIDKTIFKILEQKTSYASEQLSQFTIYKLIYPKHQQTPLVIPIEFSNNLLTPTTTLTPTKVITPTQTPTIILPTTEQILSPSPSFNIPLGKDN